MLAGSAQGVHTRAPRLAAIGSIRIAGVILEWIAVRVEWRIGIRASDPRALVGTGGIPCAGDPGALVARVDGLILTYERPRLLLVVVVPVTLNDHPCDLISGTTAAGMDLTAAPLDQRSAGLIADEPLQLHHVRDWALRQMAIWNCGP
jgi:hypothetical protein